MTHSSFIAWVSKPGWFTPNERARFDDFAAEQDLSVSVLTSGLRLAAKTTFPAGPAAIIGTVVRRGQPRSLADEELATLVEGSNIASTLIDDHWGSYVALWRLSNGQAYVMRSPFGDLPCYWQEGPNQVVLASSTHLLSAFGGHRPSIRWQSVADYLSATDFRPRQTCLTDIQELRGGEMMRISPSGLTVDQCWSPWVWSQPKHQFTARVEAAEAMRSVVEEAVAAVVPQDAPPVLLLSGGLDSSVVAAALAAGGRPFSCLNMLVDDRQGDERDYARTVADHLCVDLTEQRRDEHQVDLTRPLFSETPRPTGAQFRQATFAAARNLARAIGGTHVLDGGGGDNMFCSLQSAAPVVDQLLTNGPRLSMLTTAASIARMANVSVPAVLRQAVTRILKPRRGYRWPVDRTLLGTDLTRDLVLDHAWLDPPPNALPGKVAQVGLLLAASSAVGHANRDRDPRILSPLVCQPIAETALRVPTWMWFEDGRNRMPLRHGFALALPAPVLARRSKGTPTGFLAALVQHNAAMLRPFLLDGVLATNLVIDREAVEAALAPGPARDLSFARLLQLADAEAWARSWC